MNKSDILILGLKNKVTAISKSNGMELWHAQLPGGGFGGGGSFVTLACDDWRVFAYANGHLHCLDLSSGKLLWINELPGYGYGLASLCIPGGGAGPDIGAIKHIVEQQEASSATTTVMVTSTAGS